MSSGGWMIMHSMSRDSSVSDQRLKPGTARRVIGYGRPYRLLLAIFLVLVVIDAAVSVASPLLLKDIIDLGVTPRDSSVVVRLSLVVLVLAIADFILTMIERWLSSRIGEGLILDLRTQVFDHVLRQPIAFFTRAQTGALVSRLNSDVIGAQQAFTSVMANVVSNAVSLLLTVGAMLALSWQLTLGALVLVPLFLIPARLVGSRLAGLARTQMVLNADMGSRMTERFNVAGALLVKLFGRPDRESREYAARAASVRDAGISISMNRSFFMAGLGLVAAVATAMVYGVGGVMAVGGTLTVGTLLALAALLARLYGPLMAISTVRVDVMTALVSFERVFEVLDLEPLVVEAPVARALPTDVPADVEFENVHFRYPSADEVSLVSLQVSGGQERDAGTEVLRGIDFTAHAGQMIALVGPSGAGKTTITSLVPRLYDPTSGVVRVAGVDLREATLASISETIGVVTQEAHLFHDTIRENLLYADPDADEAQMRRALDAAQVLTLVDRLPAGLDTVVGDRGHRLSGGEKQRLAIARLLLKNPKVVVLDEATAHLDSESEAAVQRALDTALAGRTSIVIAHRLSTVRGADQILVVDDGRIIERGTHEQLLATGGLYADLYHTQFADAGAATS